MVVACVRGVACHMTSVLRTAPGWLFACTLTLWMSRVFNVLAMADTGRL